MWEKCWTVISTLFSNELLLRSHSLCGPEGANRECCLQVEAPRTSQRSTSWGEFRGEKNIKNKRNEKSIKEINAYILAKQDLQCQGERISWPLQNLKPTTIEKRATQTPPKTQYW